MRRQQRFSNSETDLNAGKSGQVSANPQQDTSAPGSEILNLQQTIGNQAVQRLLTSKKSSQPLSGTTAPADTEHQFTSAALNIRNRLGSGRLQTARIQREPKSWGGEWNAAKHNIIKDKAGKEIGVEMELHFAPGDPVNAKQIGTVQMVKSMDKGKTLAINAAVKDRNIPAGQPGEGNHIDQLPEYRNPLYATGAIPDTDTALTDTGATAQWGQHGYKYKDAAGKEQKKDATLIDAPKLSNRGADASQVFETTALAIEGEQQGTYYGSVEWGWRTDSTGKFTKLPLTLVSDNAPTSTFGAAAQQWNTTKTSKGAAALKLPIVSGKYIQSDLTLVSDPADPTKTATVALKKNTRVQLTDDGAANAANKGAAAKDQWQKVTVIEGTAIGSVGWVMAQSLAALPAPETGPGDFPMPESNPDTAMA